ncbi:relaxase domain-containing protein [Holophaga foetida]|uniref:relaxase domain-containing protein n=1 Tax=Holophaga foetida TaxID=35839 RepID=UPI0002474634|nr:relaxase domain-containing protein [Holophaga foetida]
MDLLIRYADGPGMVSSAGVAGYFGGHLQETKEGGGLVSCAGYLSRDGLVKPEVRNPDLWREVGWDPDRTELPPSELLEQLAAGYDLHETKLTIGRSLFRQPKEALITLPSEISQVLKNHPGIAREILRATVEAHFQEVEREAVRVRTGGGNREWQAARTLSLYYLHAENRGGEVHYHAHALAFLPAKALDGRWRTWENARNVIRMSTPGGSREKATDAMLASAKAHGLEVDLRRGVASLTPGMAQGATVRGLDGQVIQAGSLDRKRRVEIMAAQELKRELGGIVPLTPRELEFVRKETGKLPQKLPGERRRLALAKKLNQLGMLGKDGEILPKAELGKRLKSYERKLALAEVQLEAGGFLAETGGKHLEAAGLVRVKREQVAALAGGAVDLEASTKAARMRWTKDYERVLRMVQEAGGLSTKHLEKRDRDLLSKLKRFGLLEAQKVERLNEYRITEAGLARLRGERPKEVVVAVPPPAPEVAPEDEPFSLRMVREIREREASDPQDLRELPVFQSEEIREVFPEVELDLLKPVTEVLELADGRSYPLAPIRVTREAIHEVVDDLETACLSAAETKLGRTFERNHESQCAAETWFRAGYGLRPLDHEDLKRGWPERLGRLVRQGWERLVDQAVDLADQARRVLGLRAEQAAREELRGRPLESPFDEPRPGKPRELEQFQRGAAVLAEHRPEECRHLTAWQGKEAELVALALRKAKGEAISLPEETYRATLKAGKLGSTLEKEEKAQPAYVPQGLEKEFGADLRRIGARMSALGIETPFTKEAFANSPRGEIRKGIEACRKQGLLDEGPGWAFLGGKIRELAQELGKGFERDKAEANHLIDRLIRGRQR